MNVELNGYNTRLLLCAEPWKNGILRLVVGEKVEIPFLVPALTCHHYFTGVFSSAAPYEPHTSPALDAVRSSRYPPSFTRPIAFSNLERRS